MKFEEWWENNAGNSRGTLFKELARLAWKAAQEDMRERAAAICMDRYLQPNTEHDVCEAIWHEIRNLPIEV